MTESQGRGLLLGRAINIAWLLDQWLKERLGRPYNAALGVGLVISIGATFRTIENAVRTPGDLATAAGTVVFELVLLLNQLAQLHEFRQGVRARRQARRDARTKG